MIPNYVTETLRSYLSEAAAFCLHCKNVFRQVLRFLWGIIKSHGEIRKRQKEYITKTCPFKYTENVTTDFR